jgi:hypothetical protein
MQSNSNNNNSIPSQQPTVLPSPTTSKPIRVFYNGVLDSGAEESIIPPEIAQKLKYKIIRSETPKTIIAFNGKTSVSSKIALIGDIQANIVHSAPDTLLSVASIVDKGNSTVTFNKTSSIIQNNSNQQVQSFPRSEDGLWRIPLENISRKYNNNNEDNSIHQSYYYSNNLLPSNKLTYSAPLWHNVPKSIKKLVYNIHHRMGHASMESMCKAVSVGGSWTNSGVTMNDIRKVFHSEPCLICTLAKSNLSPPIISINHRQWKAGECLCADPVPRINPESYNKDKGFFLFVDMATGYLHTFPTKDDNSSQAYIQAIELVMRFYSTYNLKIKVLRTDKELKLMSEEVEIFLAEQQISIESSAPYAHYQNGAERNIQTAQQQDIKCSTVENYNRQRY